MATNGTSDDDRAPRRLPPGPLTSAQLRAITHIRARAHRAQPAARRQLRDVLAHAGIEQALQPVLEAPSAIGVVVLTFHPDRVAADGRTTSQALLDDGVYRSQFETKISAGDVSAYPGGDRDRWEEQLFDGAYQDPPTATFERPKYGGLDLLGYSDGPCPRFGSCCLRLDRTVMDRTTFCFGDSHGSPTAVGTIDALASVLDALFDAADRTTTALGRPGTTPLVLAHLLTTSREHDPTGPGRALDDYIETQVHGPVFLDSDADTLVADPSFRGTLVGDQFAAIAARYAVALRWNGGFELFASAVPSGFRGPAVPLLAARIAAEFGDGTGRLNAEIIGRAAQSLVLDPGRWGDDHPSEVLQRIKQLWHVLVRFGHPAS